MSMNKTGIEWADYTWNPVTGCKHGCPYCYAKGQAENPFYARAFPYGFEPHFYSERLADPAKVRTAQTVFVTSMGDLFGDWVSDRWILPVGEACDATPRHTYIFLTKNPQRYHRLPAHFFRGDKWFGTTITSMDDYHRIMTIKALPKSVNTFISFEPVLGDYFDLDLVGIPQIIIGAQTKPAKAPRLDAVLEICQDADDAGAKVFMKDSLAGLWPDRELRRELAWPIQAVQKKGMVKAS